LSVQKAVVLAAGKGTRLKPVTEEIPKVMVEIAGRPLLHYSLSALSSAGVKEAAIIVGYMADSVQEHFGAEFRGMKLTYIVQHQQMGTAHAASLARRFCGTESFLMLNGDTIFEKPLLKRVLEKTGFDCVMVAAETDNPSRYGVLEVEGDRVKNIIEKPAPGTEPSNLVNYGLYYFSPRIFEVIDNTKISPRGEFEITDSIKFLIADGKVAWVKSARRLLDITNPEDVARAEKIVAESESDFS